MIKSMTAFASNEAEIGNLIVNCELRTVNHRYCDITLKLPDRLRFIESDVRGVISSKISRGKVECSFSYKKQAKDNQVFVVNYEAVNALLHATAQIEKLMSAPRAFSALEILSFPGIQQETNTDKQELTYGLAVLLNKTLNQLLEARGREGMQLQVLLEERCIKMQHFVEAATKRIPEVLQTVHDKLRDKIVELVADPNFDRLEQELVYLTQKLDVTEELDRLTTHIGEVQRVLRQAEPIGRRLDFLMQELNREANTLGSKSADKEITQIAIELKVLIEQMREQIQNIE